MYKTNKGNIHVKDKEGRFSFLSITAVITAGFSTVKVTYKVSPRKLAQSVRLLTSTQDVCGLKPMTLAMLLWFSEDFSQSAQESA
jgi:hypothetical protein